MAQKQTVKLTGRDAYGQTEKEPVPRRCSYPNPALQRFVPLSGWPGMLKKILPLLLAPFLLGGCAATFTNLTPTQQARNANNLYPVEVSLASRQQTLRWNSIQPHIVVGNDAYPMHPTPLMTNRWEGLIPVPADVNAVHYHYKFDFLDNAFGPAQPDSASSAEYTLRIVAP
jgi:hypothetical protein